MLLVAITALCLTFFFVTSTHLVGIISTLLGSAITFLIGKIYSLIRTRVSPISGFYRDEIFSENNPTEVIKRDKFEIIEKDGHILSGDFMRYMPEKDKLTQWKCSGFIVLDQVLLAYRAMKDTIPSRGVILAKLDTTRSNGFHPCFKGKYYKFEGETIVAHCINLIRIDKNEYDCL